MHWVEGEVAGSAAAHAEGGDFGHVDPDAAPGDFVVVAL